MKNCRFCNKELTIHPCNSRLYECAFCINKNYIPHDNNSPYYKAHNGFSKHYISISPENKITIEEFFIDKSNGALHIVNYETQTLIESYLDGKHSSKWYPLMDFLRIEKLLAFL